MVTWLQLDDDGGADSVLASQCRAIDKSTYTEQSGFTAEGADQACAGSGKIGQADAATMAAVSGRAVVTVRWSSLPGGTARAGPVQTGSRGRAAVARHRLLKLPDA